MVGFGSVGVRVRRKHKSAVKPSVANEFECAHGYGQEEFVGKEDGEG
jgi:hypothetical protein